MATVVPFASCYGGTQPLQLFGRGPRGGSYGRPHRAPPARLACYAPRMTLRQICRLLKGMKQLRDKEAATAVAAAAARKQGCAAPEPASPKKCVPSGLRHKRCVKRVG